MIQKKFTKVNQIRLKFSTYEKFKVLGYVRPAEVFRTLDEWEQVVLELIELQSSGLDTRAGEISCKHASFCSTEDFDKFVEIINVCFGYQLNIETERYDLLTKKNVLDFVEDFVNHRSILLSYGKID